MNKKRPREGREKVTLRIEDDLSEALEEAAQWMGISINALCALIFWDAVGMELPF